MPRWEERDAFTAFMDKVDKGSDSQDSCWTWVGGKWSLKKDYGIFRKEKAHRWIFFYVNPNARGWDGLHIRHVCDNTLCVNPSHLEAGTNKENVADKMARGRHKTNPVPWTEQRRERTLSSMPRGEAWWTPARIAMAQKPSWRDYRKEIYGERHPNHKLSHEDVLAIKAEYVPRKMSQYMLAKKYHVSRRTIELILSGKARKYG